MADDGHPQRGNAAQPDDVVVDLCTNLLTEGVLRAVEDYRRAGVHLISQSIDPPWRLSVHARPHLDLMPDPLTALRTIAWVRRLVQEREDLVFVERIEDVHAARAEGKLGVLLHSQNATPFALDPDLVAELYAAGLRICGIASPLDVPNVAEALRARGLSAGEVAGVMGGNWMRVLDAAWR